MLGADAGYCWKLVVAGRNFSAFLGPRDVIYSTLGSNVRYLGQVGNTWIYGGGGTVMEDSNQFCWLMLHEFQVQGYYRTCSMSLVDPRSPRFDQDPSCFCWLSTKQPSVCGPSEHYTRSWSVTAGQRGEMSVRAPSCMLGFAGTTADG